MSAKTPQLVQSRQHEASGVKNLFSSVPVTFRISSYVDPQLQRAPMQLATGQPTAIAPRANSKAALQSWCPASPGGAGSYARMW